MYQQVILIGHLGADPEIRTTTGGERVANFSLATDRRWTAKDGTRQERTLWWRVNAWGSLVDVCAMMRKGALILVEGWAEEPYAYLDKEGKPQAKMQMRCSTLKFLERKPDSAPAATPGKTDTEEEIPF